MLLRVLIGVAGVLLVAGCLADMVNTLVATHTSSSRYWFASRLYNYGWKLVGFVVRRSRSDRFRNFVLTSFAPVSVLALLVGWIVQEIIGWGLIWFAIGGLKGAESLGDSMYFSGVVYFTVGFGEIVPTELVPRIGALLEAFCGVLTTALVIGYLPALFAAYSERERRLMSLDDGTEQRITPINLLLSRAAPGNPPGAARFWQCAVSAGLARRDLQARDARPHPPPATGEQPPAKAARAVCPARCAVPRRGHLCD